MRVTTAVLITMASQVMALGRWQCFRSSSPHMGIASGMFHHSVVLIFRVATVPPGEENNVSMNNDTVPNGKSEPASPNSIRAKINLKSRYTQIPRLYLHPSYRQSLLPLHHHHHHHNNNDDNNNDNLTKSKSYTLWEAPRYPAVYTYIFCIKKTHIKTHIKHI